MIDPLNRAATILDRDPESAEPLFDLLTYVSECADPRHDPQVDRVLEMVYARTEEGTTNRRSYRDKRVNGTIENNDEANDKGEPDQTQTADIPV